MRIFSNSFICAALLCLSCESDNLPEISWEGDKIRFATSKDELPCGKTLELLNDRVKEVEEELDEPLPDGKKITYYYLPGSMDASPCPSFANACTNGGLNVYTYNPIDTHELVHAVLSPLGRRPPFFEEGMAELFGREAICVGIFNDKDALKQEIETFISSRKVRSASAHLLSGAFSRFFVDTYGFAKLKEIYNSTNADNSFGDIDAIFNDVLGVSFSEVIEDFSVAMLSLESCYGPYTDCKLPQVIIPDTSETFQYKVEMDCSGKQVIGSLDENLYHEVSLVVPDVEQNYLVDVSFSPGWGPMLSVSQCGEASQLVSEYFEPDTIEVTCENVFELGAGEYQLLVWRSNDEHNSDPNFSEHWIELDFAVAR
jgi:hypothetical protein